MSRCETSASLTEPPEKPPGPRMISITPRPRSYSVAFAPGKASPWSVVRKTSVLRLDGCASSAARTEPTPWSSERALAL